MTLIVDATAFCPKCGSTKADVADGSTEDHGWTRKRRCQDCGTEYPTIEVTIPDVAYADLAADRRARHRQQQRDRRLRRRGPPATNHPGRARRPEVYVLGVKVRLSDPEPDPRRA